MTKPPRQPDPSGYRPEDQFDDVFAYGNPNPDRIGCPSPDVLRALSRRERPIEDPGYEHIANCSPCYREFRALQQARAAQLSARKRVWSLVSAAAAVVVIGAATAWFLTATYRDGDRSPQLAPESRTDELDTVLDLQKYAVTRGEHSADQPPAPTLPPGRHRLTVLLPVGTEPGRYDVQIVDSTLGSKVSASGEAHIRNYVTTLEARIDVSSVPQGEYQLALRREGDDWHFYPIVVR